MPRLAEHETDLDVLFGAAGTAEVALPRRLVTGDGSLERLGAALAALGVVRARVLVVADPIVASLGAADAAGAALRDAGFEPTSYSALAGEPDLALAEQIVGAARAEPYVAVVGIGGGSAMDPAKLAAGLATNGGAVADYVLGSRRIERAPLPFALVPTTAGTGAEASKNAIVSHDGRKYVVGDPLLSPTLALLDPLLSVSCPPAITAASGLDALAHAVEATLSTWATPFTTMNALAAVRTITRLLPAAFADGTDLTARRAMLASAHLAGLAINASTVLGHTLAYTIATRTHLPHGVTTAMALPYCVAYDAPAAAPQLRLLAGEAGTDTASFAERLRDLAEQLGIPGSLAEIGIGEEELPAMVEECLADYPRPNNPRPFDRERLLALYRHFHEGDVAGAVRTMA